MKKKKSIIFLVLLLLMGFVGTTYAYFTQSASFDNNFSIKDFEVVIEEEFDESSAFDECISDENGESSNEPRGQFYCHSEVSKKVFVVNKEEVPAVVRISYNEEIMLDQNSDYSGLFPNFIEMCDGNNNCESTYLFNKVWTQDFLDNWYFHEGWYYYKKILPASESVQVLDSVTTEYAQSLYGNYSLDFNIEAVQASSDAVKELWNQDVTINEDGTVYWGFENLEAEQ